ncbi:MAG: hypothetical protein IPL99_14725 [Candidatus Competibacteraceae bacterium]|nr:hypothetical protein [Candidatus Competibacteraceae bacterium]
MLHRGWYGWRLPSAAGALRNSLHRLSWMPPKLRRRGIDPALARETLGLAAVAALVKSG